MAQISRQERVGQARTQMTVRLREDLIEDLRKTASRENRSMANLIELLLGTGVKKRRSKTTNSDAFG